MVRTFWRCICVQEISLEDINVVVVVVSKITLQYDLYSLQYNINQSSQNTEYASTAHRKVIGKVLIEANRKLENRA